MAISGEASQEAKPEPRRERRGPRKDAAAVFLPEISFHDAMVRGLGVMDANAFGLCKDNDLPITVFNVNQPGAIARILQGERIGTLVR